MWSKKSSVMCERNETVSLGGEYFVKFVEQKCQIAVYTFISGGTNGTLISSIPHRSSQVLGALESMAGRWSKIVG